MFAGGCYFVGMEVTGETTWTPTIEVITDDLMWSVSEPEPMMEQGWVLGYTFCVENNFMDCDVTLDAELGVGPNGAYLFEATTNAEGVLSVERQWIDFGGGLRKHV